MGVSSTCDREIYTEGEIHRIAELSFLCTDLVREGHSYFQSVFICVLHEFLLVFRKKERGNEVVFRKKYDRLNAEVYKQDPEGWERMIRELHTFLVLREAEVDGYVVNL